MATTTPPPRKLNKKPKIDFIVSSLIFYFTDNAGAETRETRQRFPADSPATC